MVCNILSVKIISNLYYLQQCGLFYYNCVLKGRVGYGRVYVCIMYTPLAYCHPCSAPSGVRHCAWTCVGRTRARSDPIHIVVVCCKDTRRSIEWRHCSPLPTQQILTQQPLTHGGSMWTMHQGWPKASYVNTHLG